MCSDLVFNNFTAAFNSNFYWIFHINLYFAANRFEYACLFFFTQCTSNSSFLLKQLEVCGEHVTKTFSGRILPTGLPHALRDTQHNVFSKSPTHTRKPWRRDEVCPRVAGYNQHLLIHKSVGCQGFEDSQIYVYSLLLSLSKFLSFLVSEFCFLNIRLLYRRQMSSSTFLG